MDCPCKDCEKKGCGAFHDQCRTYQNYLALRKIANNHGKNNTYDNYKRKHYRKDYV